VVSEVQSTFSICENQLPTIGCIGVLRHGDSEDPVAGGCDSRLRVCLFSGLDRVSDSDKPFGGPLLEAQERLTINQTVETVALAEPDLGTQPRDRHGFAHRQAATHSTTLGGA
jgi:hypothetical protein